jgi:hypothetical protein
MSFISYQEKHRAGDTIAAMYADVRPRKIDNPNALQLHVWKEFEEHGVGTADVAFQLPTGQGKTLAGLGIGEWLRRTREHRVVYVCPTNQLVFQVRNQATEAYGIPLNAFVGSRDDYNEDAYRDWLSGKTLAVTNYSTIFSAGRAFADADVLLLDDAHAAEQYVAGMWTLTVGREHEHLFPVLAAIIKPSIPGPDAERLTSDADNFWDQTWVEQIPMDRFVSLHAEITEALDEHAEASELKWPWRMLKGRLNACHLYVGASQIVLRPLLPPTKTHTKFSKPAQRIYMSATLGEGGELERVFGRERIVRLVTLERPARQVVGRRFFMFPACADDNEENLLADLMRMAGRSLVLVPSERDAATVRDLIARKLGFPVFGAKDIEQSKDVFISNAQAVAVIANRYDGIDFPQDECRLTILFAMPTSTTLQERFLIDKLGCLALFNDRIRTRLVQAVSRCTRSNSDYAALIVVGTKLADYLVRREGREYLHPELQAEIRFGTDNSAGRAPQDFLDFFRVFIEQKDAWRSANDSIVKARDSAEVKDLPAREVLAAVAPLEVAYVEAMWRGDYVKAFDRCRAIVGQLTGEALKGYQALWNYLAGSAALLASDAEAALAGEVDNFYRRAAAAAVTAWPPRRRNVAAAPSERWRDRNIVVLERFVEQISTLGLGNDVKFEPLIHRILEGLDGDSSQFEQSQIELGCLLGYDAAKLAVDGAPDPYWRVDRSLVVVFEDHSSGDVDGTFPINKARQAAGHERTIRKHLDLAKDAEVYTVLVTPAARAAEEALQHLADVYLLSKKDYTTWAHRAVETVRAIRATMGGNANLEERARTLDALLRAKLAPESLVAFMTSKRAGTTLATRDE